MKLSLTFFVCVVVLLFVASFANSATVRDWQSEVSKEKKLKPIVKKGANKPNAMRELSPIEHRAISSLKRVLAEISITASSRYRSGVKSKILIADSFWNYDQALSKSVFIDTLDAISNLKPSLNQGASLSGKLPPISAHIEMRQGVLNALAIRDFSLAKKLQESLDDKSEKSGNFNSQVNKQEQTLSNLLLAKSLAKTNPQQTVQIIRESFVDGINPLLAAVLIEIGHDSPEIANNLFLEALAIARAKYGPLTEAIGPIVGYVLPREEDILLNKSLADEPEKNNVIKNFLVVTNGIILRQIEDAANNGNYNTDFAQQDYILLQMIAPLFSKYMPNSLPSLNIRKAQLSSFLSPSKSESIDKAFSNRDNYEETLRSAESAGSPKQKDMLYIRAAMQAVRSNAPDKAISIADKIYDGSKRDRFSSLIRYQTALKLLSKNKISEAQKYASEISFIPERVEIYKRLVEKFLSDKDFQNCEDTLSNIEAWLENCSNDPKKAYGFLIVAGMAAKYKPVHGFKVIKRAIRCIDNVDFPISATQSVSEFEIPVTLEMLDFSQIFSTLAKADFERALLVAQSIQNKEAGILAQIFVYRSVLDTSTVSYK